MKYLHYLLFVCIIVLNACADHSKSQKNKDQQQDFSMESSVDSGKAVSVMLTAYSTTLLADGKDKTRLRIAVTDSLNREITSASDSIRVYVSGDAHITDKWGKIIPKQTDTAGIDFTPCILQDGLAELNFIAGTKIDRIKVEVKADGLWDGVHEIHTISPDIENKTPNSEQLNAAVRKIDRMMGADISFLPQLEERGQKFFENGSSLDGIRLLKNHGMNYVRLRIFVEPGNEKGYSPGKAFCNLDHTLAMAQRVKDAGMKLMLDFHYSDYWADPQQQNKPARWKDLDFETLQDSVRAYTRQTLTVFKLKGLFPDMVQIGNEINHGLLWPDGHIGNLDQLAALLRAGVEGTRMVSPGIPVMMHIALGGQNEEAVFWLDNMLARDVHFDIIGLSYYPRWHGTLKDLESNMLDLLTRYRLPINVIEYNDFPKAVHDIVFSLPDDMGKGACIWEPLGRRSGLFDEDGSVRDRIQVYDALAKAWLSADRNTVEK